MSNLLPIAMPFKMRHDLNNRVAEFNITFYKDKNKLEDLIAFIQEYPNTRINIAFPKGVHVPTMRSVATISDKIYLRMSALDMTQMDKIKDAGIKFFFDSSMPAMNYTTLDTLIALGVSDVYIADDLCYNMREVSEYCHAHNVRLRLILNRVPATSFDRNINVRSPIYRPQDIDTLSQYYDTFEFYCGSPFDWAKFDVLYRAWFERKHWHGEMYEINPDVSIHFHNDSIVPGFTNFKLNCQRRCNQRNSNHCRKCEQFLELGKILRDKKIRFK